MFLFTAKQSREAVQVCRELETELHGDTSRFAGLLSSDTDDRKSPGIAVVATVENTLQLPTTAATSTTTNFQLMF